MDFVNIDLFADLLVLGGAGFIGGVALPFAFRIVGYIIDSVFVVLR